MNIVAKFSAAAFIVFALITVNGCGGESKMEQLKHKLDEIKSRPRGRIEPPPEFEPIANFSYSASSLRSPFRRSREKREEQKDPTPKGKQVEPDRTRSKEYLERFALQSLNMVGTITKPGQPLEALVRDASDTVSRVEEGDHLGKNYGRVTEIGKTQIDVIEIVPDGEDGWVERPDTIRLEE